MEKNQILPINLGMVKAFLIKGDGYILVDTGVEKSYQAILRFLEENKINPKEISLIVISHHHSDHVGSLGKMVEQTGAKVLIHKSEEEYLERGESVPVKIHHPLFKLLMKMMKEPVLSKMKGDILVEDTYDLKPFGVDGRVIHTPGHTKGSLAVLLESGEVVVGDSINGRIKNGKSVALEPFFWNDIDLTRVSMERLVKEGAKVFYNAHGDICDDVAVLEFIQKRK